MTLNAVWNGTQWARDAAGNSSKLLIGFTGTAFYTYAAASPSPWDDSAWVSGLTVSTTSPAASTAVKNTVCPKNIAKAWASLSLAAGTILLKDGFNVGQITIDSEDSRWLIVPFASPLATDKYVVLITTEAGYKWGYFGLKTANDFRIGLQDLTAIGAGLDMNVTTAVIDVVVFGLQDS